jgi:serine/threonine-protein kinase TTK/MPS1
MTVGPLAVPSKIDAKSLLSHDETIINPYYMAQLLNYGIKIGRGSAAEMSEEEIMREAEVYL